MQSNPYKPPTALLADLGSPVVDSKLLSTTLMAVGVATFIYWVYQFFWHLRHWSLYALQASSHAWLGPVPRAAIDVFAVVSGAMMVRGSKWLALPLAFHCIAFWLQQGSLWPSASMYWWSVLPVEIRLQLIAQFVSVGLVAAWYLKRRPGAENQPGESVNC